MLRNNFSRYLPEANILEETGVSSKILLLLLGTVLLTAFLFILASATTVDEAIKSRGQILPQKGVIQVQPSEGGVIEAIHVQNGQRVNRGSLLITLNNAKTSSEQKQVEARLMSLIAKSIRLEAFIKETPADFSGIPEAYADLVREQRSLLKTQNQALKQSLSVYDKQIDQRQSEIELTRQNLNNIEATNRVNATLLSLQEDLGKKNLSSRMSQLDAKRVHLTSEGKKMGLISQYKQVKLALREVKEKKKRFKEMALEQASRELSEINNEINQSRTQLERMNDRKRNLFIRAPIAGWIQNTQVHTIGGVFRSGDIMMEVVPAHADLHLELEIKPQDVGFVKPGQKVAVKVSSYSAEQYGKISGKMVSISPFTQMGSDGSFIYKGIVKLDSRFVGDPKEGRLILPGMTAEADVISGNRSILTYIIKPLIKSSRHVPVSEGLGNISRELSGMFDK
ncbi:MAG: HlyD family type I secretion periplasmic adaptor subunit [Magnetococcales bacterium]|nr:HlyD family type I secretion periplasmic adaptor subunit [Magnetococcales bacterium]